MISIRNSTSVELRARTTYELIRPIEAVALLLQAVNVAMSLINDQYRPEAAPVLLALAVAHLILAIVVLRHPGPLTRGYAWTAVWVASMFVMQMLIAHLLVPGDFGAHGYGVQAGNLVLVPLAVLAFYPWGGFRRPRRRWLIEISLIVAVVSHPVYIIGVMHHWDLAPNNVKSIVLYAVWAVVWYLVGKGIAELCRIAVEVQSAALVQSYRTALGDFHSYVEQASRAIDAGQDVKAVARQLREITYQRRRQLLMEEHQVGAVDIFKNAIRLFGDRLKLLDLPPLGALTLTNEVAIVLERALVDLLGNVVEHGDGEVRIDFDLKGDVMQLVVRDNGPGMTQTEFDQPGTTMQRIRRAAGEIGGDLVLTPSSGPGTTIKLTLPLRVSR